MSWGACVLSLSPGTFSLTLFLIVDCDEDREEEDEEDEEKEEGYMKMEE